MKTVTVHEAKTHLSKLLALTDQGEEILVCRGDTPVAKLVPLQPPQRLRPKVGEITSAPVHYAEDCFAPLSDDEAVLWGLK